MGQQGRRARRTKAKSSDDQFWIIAMGTIVALMLAVMVFRWWQDRQPTSVRYGVTLIPAERAGGQVILPLANAPTLTTDGGVAGIQAGGLEAFVVRISETDYRVYSATSAGGRKLRYDPVAGVFVDRKDEKVTFERSSGTQVGGEDRMPRYLCNLSADRLEIQPVRQ